MQKFGLQRHAKKLPNAIELEIAKEQATSLGRAGRKLRLSLERYNNLLQTDISGDARAALLKEISSNVWALMVQREFVGFVDGNLEWVQSNYAIPAEAIKMLGR